MPLRGVGCGRVVGGGLLGLCPLGTCVGQMVPSHLVSWQKAEPTGGGFGQESFSTKSKEAAGALTPAPVVWWGAGSGSRQAQDWGTWRV